MCLIYGLDLAGKNKSIYGIAGLIILLGCLLTSIFTFYAMRCSEKPFININLFKISSFSGASGLLFLSSIVFYGGMISFPLILVKMWSFSVLKCGFYLGIHSLGALLSRRYVLSLSQRIGVRESVFIALMLTVIGSGLLFIPHISSFSFLLSFAIFIRGAGLGFVTLIAMSNAYEDIEALRIPDASILTRVVTLLGASLSSSIIALIFSNEYDVYSVYKQLIFLTIVTLFCYVPANFLVDRRP